MKIPAILFFLLSALPAYLSLGSSAAAAQGAVKDITEEAGINFHHNFGDDKLSNIVESAGVGVAMVDYDNDGNLDIYFVNGAFNKDINHPKGRKWSGKLRNALYRNQGDGTFVDVTEAVGVDDEGYGMAALFADIDNDGDQDLYLTNYGRNKLYRNNGNGTFTDITDHSGVGCKLWSLGATFLDYDRDGWLDLYVGNYLQYDPDYQNYYAGDGFPGPLAYNGQPDILYHNRGNGTFEDVTRKAGVFNPQGRAMGVGSTDIDNDGYMDIYVANDAMENFLYRNNGDGTFSNIALYTGTAFGQNGEATSAMSPEFGDIDNDGFIDILIPDMGYSSLFVNSAQGFFTEISSLSGLAAACGQYTSWSGNFLDFDGDSLLDIFMTNGDSHFYEPEEDLLLHNVGGRKLKDISRHLGNDFQQKNMGRGSAVGDIDNDGDLDIVVTNLGGKPILYKSETNSTFHWLQIRIQGTTSNRDGIGTRVKISTPQATQTRDVISSSGYLSQSDSRLHFGLGKNTKVDTIEIIWPDGKTSVFNNINADQLITYKEPQ